MPFVLELVGEDDLRIPLSIRYPHGLELSASDFGQQLLIFVLEGIAHSGGRRSP